MLVPVLVHKNYKITTTLTLTLETVVGVNLPLMFPDVQVINRTPTSSSAAISGVRRMLFTTQADADFDGTVTSTLFTSFALSNGQGTSLGGLVPSGLVPVSYGVNHELTIANAGPAAQLRISLVIKGLVETAVSPDPFIVVNV